MEKNGPYLSVVIPAYNEEKRITPTLGSVYAYLSAQPFTWEILVALDGPKDNTLAVVQDFAAGKPEVRWLDRAENRGKGFTVRAGMLAAKGQIRLFMDADNSTDISHFDQMQPLFDAGYDVVIGSRDDKDVPGAWQAVPQPFMKRLLGDAGNLFIQLMAVPGIWDTQCGFKGFTAVATQRIFSVSKIDRWGFDMEALAIARKNKYRIGIIPTRWIDDANTHVNLRDYVNTIFEVLRVRWNLLTGAYQKKTGD
jgi:dolichyl-phosphate beta-glucosyltransferase